MTIANPGGFIEGVSINNLLTAEPHGRNPQLSDALKRIGLAEKTGRGIDRIFEGSLIYGKPLPDYTASTAVTVSLFIARSKPDVQLASLVSSEQNRLGHPLSISTLLVLNTLKDLPRSTVDQLADAIRLSAIATKSILDTCIECGIVDGFGQGRGRTYILSAKVYKTKAGRMVVSKYTRRTDRTGKWMLSPAYDITFSYNPSNKWLRAHQMTINGKTTEIGLSDLLEAGAKMWIKEKRCKDIISEIVTKVSGFKFFAEQVGITEKTYNYISSVIDAHMIKI